MEFDRKDICMNKLVATTLEQRCHVFDMRTHNEKSGFATISMKVGRTNSNINQSINRSINLIEKLLQTLYRSHNWLIGYAGGKVYILYILGTRFHNMGMSTSTTEQGYFRYLRRRRLASLVEIVAHWTAYWTIDCWIDWLTDKSIDWMNDWSNGWLNAGVINVTCPLP